MTTATIDQSQIICDAIKKVTSLATLPEVTTRIISTVEDPKSSAAQLHKIVAHDPALATRILKVVNSAFYGLPGQVGSIERATVLLGLNAVKNLAVAASLGQMFRGAVLCPGYSAKDLWTHCVAVAVTSRELARKMKVPIADEAFLAGMIHDVGILVELQIWPEQLRLVCDQVLKQGKSFCQAEQDLLHVDHQTLGAALTAAWKFPRACQDAAGFHHDPSQADESSQALVRIVHTADILCCEAKVGFGLTAANESIDETLIEQLGIDAPTIEQLRANIKQSVMEAMSVMG